MVTAALSAPEDRGERIHWLTAPPSGLRNSLFFLPTHPLDTFFLPQIIG
jgi:hypothetical protein